MEVGSGQIREVAPSVPGPCADPTLLRDSGALARLPPGTRMLGDKAYRWKKTEEASALPPVALPRRKPRGKPLPPEDGVFNGAFACVRITVEHVIRDLRIDQALSHVDRHRRQQHTARTCAVVELRARRCRPGRRDQRRLAYPRPPGEGSSPTLLLRR